MEPRGYPNFQRENYLQQRIEPRGYKKSQRKKELQQIRGSQCIEQWLQRNQNRRETEWKRDHTMDLQKVRSRRPKHLLHDSPDVVSLVLRKVPRRLFACKASPP